MQRIISLLLMLLVFIATFVGAEFILRLSMPFELVFNTGTERGIHTPNDQFGFVYTDNYKGLMYHSDKVPGVPLHLDKYGFRMQAQSYLDNRQPDDVVLMGGASMIFSYGLQDEFTVARQVARNAECPISVYTTSQPGFDMLRNFHIYRAKLEKDIHPKLVVLFLYNESVKYALSLPEDFMAIQSAHSHDELFQYFDDLVAAPQNKFALWLLGKYYYDSYYLIKLLYAPDRLFQAISDGYKIMIKKMEFSNVETGIADKNEKVAAEKFVKTVSFLNEYFLERGSKFQIVFAPSLAPQNDQFLDTIKHALPPDIVYFDLRKLKSRLKSEDFVADGHYGQKATSELGKNVAKGVCEVIRRP
jgi:hypothetical protein